MCVCVCVCVCPTAGERLLSCLFLVKSVCLIETAAGEFRANISSVGDIYLEYLCVFFNTPTECPFFSSHRLVCVKYVTHTSHELLPSTINRQWPICSGLFERLGCCKGCCVLLVVEDSVYGCPGSVDMQLVRRRFPCGVVWFSLAWRGCGWWFLIRKKSWLRIELVRPSY